MALLLAPYTHAMRLGQGFNSYTQQICIDDAVVTDENRAENVVTNDGTTMRIMAQKSATPSAWTRRKEVIESDPATAVLVENAKKAKAEVAAIEAELADNAALEAMLKDDEATVAGKVTNSKPKESVAHENKDPVASKDSVKPSATKSSGSSAGADKPKESSASDKAVESAAVASKKATTAEETAEEEDTATDTDEEKTVADVSEKTEAPKETVMKPSTSETPKADKPVETERGRASSTVSGSKNDQLNRKAASTDLAEASKKAAQKKPLHRARSSDKAHQHETTASTDLHNRGAIRAALTGKGASDPNKEAKEKAEKARREKEEAEILAEKRRYIRELERKQREEEVTRRAEEREEQRLIRKEKREWDAKRRQDARQAIENAGGLKAMSMADMEKIRAQNQFVERFNGMSEQDQKFNFDPTAPRGPSQTVTYTSRFVDRLSDVLDDMSVSGSLSIKAGKIGGSGKGSFVDSDKFKESDLNFYISVKVVNQTINFKDALIYNPVRSVNAENFREVFGDSFISGFIEGGEFNAIVSMKILNKAKKTDIQAEAKIALTAGAVQIEAEANVGIARSNIETNTETTIQVSWSGGGHIKPMEQQWDIQSLMAAAARFPDLVAECPQRIYAILTKYDSLRTFVATKPAAYTALQYENAQIYTNTLLDSFVSYKALYKRLGEQIFGVQGKVLEILPWSDSDKEKVSTESKAVVKSGTKNDKTGLYPFEEVNDKFEASIKGLSDARAAIRRQMARIVNEVDAIEKDPKLATDEDHLEPFQYPTAFEARIPVVEMPIRLRVKNHPLSGRRIAAKVLSEDEQKKQINQEEELFKSGPLYTEKTQLDVDEQQAFSKLLVENPSFSGQFMASSVAGSSENGKPFNNLDFLKPDWNIRSIRTEMANGALVYLAVSYENGLLVEKGTSRDKARIKKFGPFLPGEQVYSAAIEHGYLKGKPKDGSQVLGLRLFTNRGRSLIARPLHSDLGGGGIVIRDGVNYEQVKILYMDVPFQPGSIKGFFGRSDDGDDGKIYRLGIIWSSETATSDVETELTDTIDTIDSEDLAQFQAGEKATRAARLERAAISHTGSFQATNYAQWSGKSNPQFKYSQKFDTPLAEVPKVLFGMIFVSGSIKQPLSLALRSPEVSAREFSVSALGSGEGSLDLTCKWMTLPNDLHLETGIVSTFSPSAEALYDIFTQEISFSRSFTSPPIVRVWIQSFDCSGAQNCLSINCHAESITPHSFYVKINSALDGKFKSARVQYLAYSAEESGRRIKSGRLQINKGLGRETRLNPLNGPEFSADPSYFWAFSGLNIKGTSALFSSCGLSGTRAEMNIWPAVDDGDMNLEWIGFAPASEKKM